MGKSKGVSQIIPVLQHFYTLSPFFDFIYLFIRVYLFISFTTQYQPFSSQYPRTQVFPNSLLEGEAPLWVSTPLHPTLKKFKDSTKKSLGLINHQKRIQKSTQKSILLTMH